MTAQEEFQFMLDRSGLTAWHNAGFKGQGINILNCDDNKHGSGMENILKRTALYAKVMSFTTEINTKGDELIEAVVDANGIRVDLHKFVKLNNIHIINCSRSGINDNCAGWNDYSKRMQEDTEVVIFNAAGNKYEGDGETLTTQFPHNVAILVGALNVDRKRIIYSSVGEELDFMAFSGLIGGTSAASPFLAGMTACIFSKHGKMSPAATKAYLKSISKDLGTAGDDIYHGDGMPVLGDPYEEVKKMDGQTITGILREIDVKKLPGGEIKRVKAILYNGENYTRLRDNEDVLDLVDVEYDAVNKLPIVED